MVCCKSCGAQFSAREFLDKSFVQLTFFIAKSASEYLRDAVITTDTWRFQNIGRSKLSSQKLPAKLFGVIFAARERRKITIAVRWTKAPGIESLKQLGPFRIAIHQQGMSQRDPMVRVALRNKGTRSEAYAKKAATLRSTSRSSGDLAMMISVTPSGDCLTIISVVTADIERVPALKVLPAQINGRGGPGR